MRARSSGMSRRAGRHGRRRWPSLQRWSAPDAAWAAHCRLVPLLVSDEERRGEKNSVLLLTLCPGRFLVANRCQCPSEPRPDDPMRRPRRAESYPQALPPTSRKGKRVIDNSGHRVGGNSVNQQRTAAIVCTVFCLGVRSAPHPKSRRGSAIWSARAALPFAAGPSRAAGRVPAKTARTLVSSWAREVQEK